MFHFTKQSTDMSSAGLADTLAREVSLSRPARTHAQSSVSPQLFLSHAFPWTKRRLCRWGGSRHPNVRPVSALAETFAWYLS
jgi:hypothetical protein